MSLGLFTGFQRQSSLLSALRLSLLLALIGGMGLFPAARGEGFFVTEENAAVYRKIPDIENQLYGHDYANQAISQRISRIERTLFGGPQRGPTEQRMQQVEARINEKRSQAVKAEQGPMLAYLEEKLFQRTYPDKSTPERLRQLESQVFGRSFDSYPVEIRMKKLTYAMPVMAREIRLTKGDMVIASAGRVSRRAPRSPSPKVEMVQLDAAGSHPIVHSGGMSVSTGDYAQSIYRESSGGVLRWQNLPINVYLKPAEEEVALSVKAVQAWKSVFSLQLVPSSSQADVIVSWDKGTWDMDTTGIIVRPVVQVDESRNIRTVILVNLYPFKDQSSANQLHLVSHVLGHAFGLWGHSDDPSDIMYPALKQELNDFPNKWAWRSASVNAKAKPVGVVEDFHPSQRDINTLIKIYNLPSTDLKSYSWY